MGDHIAQQVNLQELYAKVAALYMRNIQITSAVDLVSQAMEEEGVLRGSNHWDTVHQMLTAWSAHREEVVTAWAGARGELPTQETLAGRFRTVEALRSHLKDHCKGFLERCAHMMGTNAALIELNDQAVHLRAGLITTAAEAAQANNKVQALELQVAEVVKVHLQAQDSNRLTVEDLGAQVARCQLSCAAAVDQLASAGCTPRSTASTISYGELANDYCKTQLHVALQASQIQLTPEEIERQYGR